MTGAEKVYQAFRDDPEKHERSYLVHGYKRGIAGLSAPEKSKTLLYAAWRAGRDARAEGKTLGPQVFKKQRTEK